MRRILFVILSLCLQLNTVASDATTNGGQNIGEGVSAKVEVLYDSSYYEATANTKTHLEKIVSTKNDVPSRDYFEDLFKKVREHFNKQSVMINITVGNVRAIGNISVPYGTGNQSIYGNQTLQKLIGYGGALGASNNTVYCLFTPKNIYEESNRGDRQPISRTEIATQGSFCTNNTSAAVVKLYFTGRSYLATVSAMAMYFWLWPPHPFLAV
uniref:Putative secreted protein n=1 Tax=Amblyomma cajennense TaxID=34607 RepID=A0A023FC56_AMBCJ